MYLNLLSSHYSNHPTLTETISNLSTKKNIFLRQKAIISNAVISRDNNEGNPFFSLGKRHQFSLFLETMAEKTGGQEMK